MWDLMKSRRARKVALHTLEPFVARCGLMPESSVLLPHALGFLSKLVTLIAVRQSGEMQTHAIASVQSSVIMRMSGAGQEVIGEGIHFLSSTDDPDFVAGCHAAQQFFRQLMLMGPETEPRQHDREDAQNALDLLWREHVAARLPCHGGPIL